MKIGAQLYTVREFTKTRQGFVDSLDRIAEMGYDGVQLSAVGCMESEVSAGEAATLLNERNLVCAATHRPWNILLENIDSEIEFHKALSCSYVAIGSAPSGVHAAGIAGYRDWLVQAQVVSQWLFSEAIDFGYHNHSIEFERMPERPFDILIDEAPWLALELDTYWAHHAGVSIVSIVNRLDGRIPVVHVKDMAVFGWDVSYAPVGEGNLDWDAIVPAMKEAGTEWLLVEQDECRRDPFDCLASSARFLRNSFNLS